MLRSSLEVLKPVGFSVRCGPNRVHRAVFQPASGSSLTLVFLSGSGKTDVDGSFCLKKTLAELAGGFAARGFSSLRFGKRAVPPHDALDYVDEYLSPLASVLDYSSQQRQAGPLVLVGHSLGGHVLPLVHSAFGERVVAGVLLNAPYRSLQRTIAWQTTGFLSRAEHGARFLPQRYAEFASLYSPRLEFCSRPLPLLVVTSGHDALVHPDDALSWEALGKSVTRMKFPRLDHFLVERERSCIGNQTLAGNVSAELLDGVARWIRQVEEGLPTDSADEISKFDPL